MKRLKQLIVSIALVFALAIPAFALVGCNMLKSNKNNNSDQQDEQQQSQALTISQVLNDFGTHLLATDELVPEKLNVLLRDKGEHEAITNELKSFDIPYDDYEGELNADQQAERVAAINRKAALEERQQQLEELYDVDNVADFEDKMNDLLDENVYAMAYFNVGIPSESGTDYPGQDQYGELLNQYHQWLGQNFTAVGQLAVVNAKENTPYMDSNQELVFQYSISDNMLTMLINSRDDVFAVNYVYDNSKLVAITSESYYAEKSVEEFSEPQESGPDVEYTLNNSTTNLQTAYYDVENNMWYQVSLHEEYSIDSRNTNKYVPALEDFVAAYNAGKMTSAVMNKFFNSDIDYTFMAFDVLSGKNELSTNHSLHIESSDPIKALKAVKSKINTLPTETVEFDINLFDIEELEYPEEIPEEMEELEKYFVERRELLNISKYDENLELVYKYDRLDFPPKTTLAKGQAILVLTKMVKALQEKDYNQEAERFNAYFGGYYYIDAETEGQTFERIVSGLNNAKRNLQETTDWDGETLDQVYVAPGEEEPGNYSTWKIREHVVTDSSVVYRIDTDFGYNSNGVNIFFELSNSGELLNVAILMQYIGE
ncbi:MAG: hypothetical protein IJ542_01555 [Clostridia bacterium]|nr:hypothetical protein [Clostridia bacterium]